MLRLAALLLVSLALASAAAAAKGGPAPGVLTGQQGVVDRAEGVRYVALPGTTTTTVAAVRVADGRILRYALTKGLYGVPLVAFDGTAEGLSRDGRTLVLGDFAGLAGPSTFLVFRTSPLTLQKRITLTGGWAYDALSPDGRTMYALHYRGTGANARYDVRAVSLVTGKPVGGPIVDRYEPDEEMHGAPWARAHSPNGAWAYTLYVKPGGTAFVHALNTAQRNARCIDLPWRSTQQALNRVRLSVERRGKTLVLSKAGKRLAVVDTQTFSVRTLARP